MLLLIYNTVYTIWHMYVILALLSYMVYRTEKCINALLHMLHGEYDMIHVCCLGTLISYTYMMYTIWYIYIFVVLINIYDVYDMINVDVCCLGTFMLYDVYDKIRVSIFGAAVTSLTPMPLYYYAWPSDCGLTSWRLLGWHIRQCCFGIPLAINTIKGIKSTKQKNTHQAAICCLYTIFIFPVCQTYYKHIVIVYTSEKKLSLISYNRFWITHECHSLPYSIGKKHSI